MHPRPIRRRGPVHPPRSPDAVECTSGYVVSIEGSPGDPWMRGKDAGCMLPHRELANTASGDSRRRGTPPGRFEDRREFGEIPPLMRWSLTRPIEESQNQTTWNAWLLWTPSVFCTWRATRHPLGVTTGILRELGWDMASGV